MGFFSSLKNDMKSLVSGIFSDKPAPFASKKGERGEAKKATRSLLVKEVIVETPDARTIVLTDPSGAPLEFEAGQFFTLLRKIDGKEVRRAYSASSSASVSSEVRVTVKQIEGGLVSPRLVKELRAGETLEVAGPSGQFTLPKGRKHAVLLGGGSGITPLMSIARTHLALDPELKLDLVFGNRGKDDIIFREELSALVEEHAGRFRVRHVLENADPIASHVGRLDRATVLAELDALESFASATSMFFLCGPVGMMDEAKAALESRGVSASRIKEERFVSPSDSSQGGSEGPEDVEVSVQGDLFTVTVQPGMTILEAAQDAGVEIPFSCTVGGCASCRVKLVAGKVALGEPNCLDPDERKEGYILACVSRPLGPCKVEVE